MARVQVPGRLAMDEKLRAQGVEDAFAAIITAINGGLTTINLSEHARIPNAMKDKPYSLVPIQIVCPVPSTGIAYKYYVAIPGPGSGVLGANGAGLDLTLVRWGAAAPFSATLTGTAILRRPNASGVQTTLDTATYTGVVPPALLWNRALSGGPAGLFDKLLEIEVQTSVGTATLRGIAITIWAKAKHVR